MPHLSLQSFTRWRSKLKPPHQFRNLKYDLLGVQAPPVAVYPSLESWSETDTLAYLRQTRILAQTVISQLASMSELSQKPVDMPQIRQCLRPEPRILQDLRMDNYTLPEKDVDNYVLELTKHDYGPRATSDIDIWLYKIAKNGGGFGCDNCNTINQMIGYFIATNDLQMANFWVKCMLRNGVTPTRVTMHLLLAYQARKVQGCPYPVGGQSGSHPLIHTHDTLKIMSRAGVRADSATWNLVLRCMPLGFGKSFMVEEMDRRQIPLDSKSRAEITKIIAENRSSQQDSDNLGNLLPTIDPRDPAVLRTVVDNVLTMKSKDNFNVQRAWDLIVTSTPADKSTETMNVVLKHFGRRGHVDWQFGVMSHFSSTQWDPETWQLFLEGTWLSRESPQKYILIGTLLKQMERLDVPFTSRARYLARRALRSPKFQLRDIGSDGWAQLCESLRWKSCFMPSDKSMLSTIGFGEGASLPSTEAKLDESRFAMVERTDTPDARLKLARTRLQAQPTRT